MAQNFIECDREQLLLMSPSLREWRRRTIGVVPDRRGQGHGFVGVLRALPPRRLGRAAYDPAMMVAIVLYAHAKAQRSSRGIERGCVEDIAYRVMAANLAPILGR